MKPTILPTGPSHAAGVATDATVLPFKKVVARTFPPGVQACLDLLESLKAKILAGEYSPTGLILCVVENRDETEESLALSVGLNRMEIIGNLYALATEITVEPA